VANAWGAVAVRAFADTYERDPVGGTTTAAVAAETAAFQWANRPAGGALDLPWPPAPADLVLAHAGAGAPWATIRALAAIPLAAPAVHGLAVERSVEPVEVRESGRWHVGDLARVRLRVDARQDVVWLVVDDPLPAGAGHVGDGLGGSGALAAEAGRPAGEDDWSEPTFIERSQEAWRAYWETASPGRLEQSYVMRLGQAGTFQLPSTRAEALYDPALYGETPNAALEVHP
jgi:uncharacterized protein YfaS (alpha-2-macroglobulin family)